ncbi:MAG TPA: efflux RND transporter periplasmic adaptor subunit [Sumerlaeia bacterium]|nr:efflux RND transporter periplasmic adaptor subunit [Sumerlaeia bacterium]
MRNLGILLVGAFLLHLAAASAVADEKEEKTTLFPGESFEYKGVKVTWEVSPDDVPTTEHLSKPLGRVSFVGPKAKIENVDAPLLVDEAGLVRKWIVQVTPKGRGVSAESGAGTYGAYLDGILFRVRGDGRKLSVDVHLTITASAVPARREFDAKPQVAAMVYLSSVCPVQLNEWNLSLSEKPVRYPGGSEFLQIAAANARTSEEVTLPATPGAMRRLGRFLVSVQGVYPETRTASLKVTAEADLTVRGRDAWCPTLIIKRNESFARFLERFARDHGFEVEWVEFPAGEPQSVTFAKEGEFSNPGALQGGLVSDVLQDVFDRQQKLFDPQRKVFERRTLALEWRDATHLRVWAKDYDKTLAEKEKETRENAARERFSKEEAEEKKRFLELFEKEYRGETRVYPLTHISAQTAKELVEDQLDTHYLVCWHQQRREPDGRCVPLLFNGEDGYFAIQVEKTIVATGSKEWRGDPKSWPKPPLRTLRETAVADAKSNALIVTAIPKTHEKIREALGRWDGVLLATEKPKGPVERYRIEAALLEGEKKGKASATVEPIKLSFRYKGIIDSVSVRVGSRVKKGDPIAHVLPDRAPARVVRAEENIKMTALSVEQRKRVVETTAQLVQAGKGSQSDLEQKEAELRMREADLKAAEEALARAREYEKWVDLRAPFDGTVSSVAAYINQPVNGGDVVATILPDPPSPEAGANKGEEAKAGATGAETAKRYGITKKDLDLFEIAALSERGRGVLTLVGERGELGRATLALTPQYRFEVDFADVREPYVIVKARLVEAGDATAALPAPPARPVEEGAGAAEAPASADAGQEKGVARSGKVLLENTLFLEEGKPSVLGLTNLRQSLVLVVTLPAARP